MLFYLKCASARHADLTGLLKCLGTFPGLSTLFFRDLERKGGETLSFEDCISNRTDESTT